MRIILRKIILFTFIQLTAVFCCRAQIFYQPYSFTFSDKLSSSLYSPQNDLHTAFRPYIIAPNSILMHSVDSVLNRTTDTAYKHWIYRKIFNEHLFDDRTNDYTFYFDYLPDLDIGKDLSAKRTTWLNTRGYQLGGTLGTKFFFYSSAYENQGQFAGYEDNYIRTTAMVPGQAYNFNGTAPGSKDWMYVTALAGYVPSDAVSIEAGIDKVSIGDGYRSMLLSDFASNYPLLRVRWNITPRLQYVAMWAYLEDQDALKLDTINAHTPNRAKWAVFHYIDWNITNRASLGFFNALIAPDAYDNGSLHGFDANYIDPVLFLKSIAPQGPIPDNTLIGFNAKYKVLNKAIIYGQLLLDQSSASGKRGMQLGFRGADLFKINSLNYLFEYNTATPGTYTNQYPLINYTELDEPLAHPFGNNFHEWVGLLNYSPGRFDFQGELDYANYLLSSNTSTGIIPLPPVTSVDNQPVRTLFTTFKFAQGKVSYLINSKTNLRIEASGVLREESNAETAEKTVLFTIGLRSTFRDLYNDF
jgi:hypothetical protein